MSRNRIVILLATLAVLCYVIHRMTRTTTDLGPRGYHDVGSRDAERVAQSMLSPDVLLSGHQHIAHPNELDAVITGRHPLYNHPSTCSPNWSRVQAEGWAWVLESPSEVSL